MTMIMCIGAEPTSDFDSDELNFLDLCLVIISVVQWRGSRRYFFYHARLAISKRLCNMCGYDVLKTLVFPFINLVIIMYVTYCMYVCMYGCMYSDLRMLRSMHDIFSVLQHTFAVCLM